MVITDTEGDNEEAIASSQAMGFSPRGQYPWLGKTLH